MRPNDISVDTLPLQPASAAQLARVLPTATILKRFSVFLVWPVLLVAAPLVVANWGAWTLAVSLPLGVYCVMWAALLRHEVWHRNFEQLGMLRMFNALSYLIFLDPRPYLMSHGPHHRLVHTSKDVIMFYDPEDVHNKAKLKRYFLIEAIAGNAAWEIITLKRLLQTGRITRRSVLENLPKRLFVVALTAALAWAFGGMQALAYFPVTTLGMMWCASLFARHVQWIEHLGILGEGSMEERSMLTRNLSNRTVLGWLFNLLTLSEAWNHTYHHVEPDRALSALDHVEPRSDHLTVTFGQYVGLLRAYYRSLC